MTPLDALRTWPRRRWLAALAAAAATVLIVGVPTVLVPNPVFGRAVPVTWWAWPVLLATAALAGLLTATYVQPGPRETGGEVGRAAADGERPSRLGLAGGLLGYFAVGCPVCNKIVLLALGYTGALRWFAPVQPVLAVAGIVLLAVALQRRLAAEAAGSCAVRTW